MMLSSKRVLKPSMVNLDIKNKIVIETGLLTTSADNNDPVQIDPEKREKDVQKSAAGIIRNAERQAEEIRSRARVESEHEKSAILKKTDIESAQVLAESRKQGYKEGMETATCEGNAIKAEARQVLEDAKAEHKKMQESLEPEIVSMIIAITEKLLGNITELCPAVILNLIKQGFAEATISGDVTVYVSAQDYEKVLENKYELMALAGGAVELQITKDLSLLPMDCVIETPFGNIDCSLNQQFKALRENLTFILTSRLSVPDSASQESL